MLVTVCLDINLIPLANNTGQQVLAIKLRSTHLGHARGQLMEKEASSQNALHLLAPSIRLAGAKPGLELQRWHKCLVMLLSAGLPHVLSFGSRN